MTRTFSTVYTVILAMVMVGVIFGIFTDSRNSILIKEMVYVAGGALAALLGGILVLKGTLCFQERIPRYFLPLLAAVIIYSSLRHVTGCGSVNGPFTIMMLLSLSVLTVTGLLFVDARGFRLLTGILLISSAILFIYAAMQWQGVTLFPWDANLTRSGRSTGSLGNANLLGGFASAMLPLGVTALIILKKPSKLVRYLSAGLFGILAVLAVISSGTRGSLLGLTAGCGFMAFWYIRKYRISLRATLPVLLILAAVLAATALPMSSRLAELDPDAEEQGTLQVRKLIWSGALAVFADNPLFGHGPGSFQILYPAHRSPDYSILGVSHNTLHAHCEYLEILVDLGITGLLFWGAIAFLTFKKLRDAGPLRAAAFAGIAAMLVEALVSVHLRWPPTAWLFSFFAMLSMSADVKPVKTGFRKIPLGAALVLSAVFLSAGFVKDYVPAMKSSRLIFMGKDYFLNRTESAMQNAYSAAEQWRSTGDPGALDAALSSWSVAVSCADSSVYYSRLGTEAYSADLGSWYALGSAHLTRYMILQPPFPAMQEALEYSGSEVPYTKEELQAELESGMEAYDFLVSMAPNYAEVHNNLALGYSNMGLVDKALEELYNSYRLHGHRRNDYYQQAVSLLPLSDGSAAGCTLIFHHTIRGYMPGVSEERRQSMLRNIGSCVSLIYSSLPDKIDSLKVVFTEIAESEFGPEEAAPIAELVQSGQPGTLFRWWSNGEYEAEDAADFRNTYLVTLAQCVFAGSAFPGELPAEKEFYTLPLEILKDSGFSRECFDWVMRVLLYQIEIDRNLDTAFTLASSSRFSENVSEEVIDRLNQVREASGGSRTALRNGEEMPWLDGSLPDLLSDTLQVLEQQDSLESTWYEMEFEMTFLFLSSYWWDYQIFSRSQNQYLLDRAFYCRDMIMTLNPDSWQGRISAAIQRTMDKSALFMGSQSSSQLEQLKGDLVEGVERALEPVPE